MSRLVLVLGDLFIPDRAPDLPAKFKTLLTPNKIHQILCTGNLTDRPTYDFLRSLAPDLHITKGPYDVDAPNLPPFKIVTHGNFRIGLTHGTSIVPPGDLDSLLIMARQMDVDVLIWGGGHKVESVDFEGRFFVNPGSATGAVGEGWGEEECIPSFCLMDIQGDVLNLYIYKIIKGEDGSDQTRIERCQFRRMVKEE
ncbi:MAG: Vacuolar protein sorting-associated protein 29 [Cirrosporium novae-zelandiae]|nr:MAG: Vacuolar protein sorting-associated protein 29 [Cirrosporium novae-zelandiae]